MSNRDLYSEVLVKKVTAPISPAATGTITGTVVDRSGFSAVTFIISAGAQTTTGVTVTPTIVSGSATGSLSAVADSLLIGTEAAAALDGTAGAGSSSKIGYIGADRYVSCNTLVAGAATGVYSVQCLLTSPSNAPQA